MREQPLATWLAIGGTALSIFLVVAVFTISDINSVEYPPETCRRSLLVADGVDVSFGEDGSGSASMSMKTIDLFYRDLQGIERMALSSSWEQPVNMEIPGKAPVKKIIVQTDDEYWRLYDFDFLSGRPFTKAEVESHQKLAILTQSTARILFGTDQAVGRDVLINQVPHRIVGVVRDVNPVMKYTFANTYVPLVKETPPVYGFSEEGMSLFGSLRVHLKMQPGVDRESVCRQVEDRYKAFNARMKPQNIEAVYHGQPYDVETDSLDHGSNTTPEAGPSKRIRWITYVILLLLPAINLSGMSRSRLRRRVAEIGVRRAFGASRLHVAGQLLGENFLITLIGGLIGLILCLIGLALFSDLFFTFTDFWSATDEMIYAKPPFMMLFTWKAVGFATLFCFFLNLISAGYPIWKATAMPPAEAISGAEYHYQK